MALVLSLVLTIQLFIFKLFSASTKHFQFFRQNLNLLIMTFSISSLLHSGFQHSVTRSWQLDERKLTKESLVFPVFIHDLDDVMEEIPSMPGQYRYGIKHIKDVFAPLVENGLKTVLIFGVPTSVTKDELGSVSLFY